MYTDDENIYLSTTGFVKYPTTLGNFRGKLCTFQETCPTPILMWCWLVGESGGNIASRKLTQQSRLYVLFNVKMGGNCHHKCFNF